MENELKKQITSFQRGKRYLEVKSELLKRYEHRLATKMTQRAFVSYKMKDSIQVAVFGVIMLLVTHGYSFYCYLVNGGSYPINKRLNFIGILSVVVGLVLFFRFRRLKKNSNE